MADDPPRPSAERRTSNDALAAIESGPGMTIEALAERSRLPVRTLRLYQTKSLLPPPQIVGRVGYYSQAHVNRLVTIDRLRRRGFSLAGIAEIIRMFEQGYGIDELLGYERLLAAPDVEAADRVTKDEFPVRYPRLADNEVLRRKAIDLGVLVPVEDEGFVVPSANLLEFGLALVERGVPADVALQELQNLQEDLSRIASRFIGLFRAHILPRMLESAGEEWLLRLEKLEKAYRPAMRTLVASLFTREMDRAIARARGAVGRMASEAVDPGTDGGSRGPRARE